MKSLNLKVNLTSAEVNANLNSALSYALHCFKHRAMTLTSSQLESQIEDILKWQAVWDNSGHKSLKYKFINELED